ncbi:MAG: ATP-dependent DNA helicase DinG [Nitrococcus sp.]|nr:ATP-dependent DNA helicase DinG [Nitrococcus sp.]
MTRANSATPARRDPSAEGGSGERSGLAETTKQQIRDALARLTANPTFKPRRAQRLMIAEIAKTLAGEYPGERVACVEGPTGTGKSVGYLLPAIPVAKARKKTLVISTATVALQEQLVGKDLPDLQARAGLEFTFALAKGRRRYVCDRNLERLLGVDTNQARFDFGDADEAQATWTIRPEDGELAEVQAMWQGRQAQTWGGDVDEWPNQLRPELRDEITTDKTACTGANCPWRGRCAFFAARKAREAKDVIVANHALVLTDLILGGGVVLPDPETCIYIFDEGHHLPDVAVQQGTAHTRLIGPRSWLTDLTRLPTRAAAALAGQSEIAEAVETLGSALAGEIPLLIERLNDIHRALQSAHPALKPGETSARAPGSDGYRRTSDANWRFPLGRVPEELRALFEEARAASSAVNALTLKLIERIRKGAEADPDNRGVGTAQASAQWTAGRIEAMETAFAQLASAPSEDPNTPPVARWIECLAGGSDFECCASPTSAAELLRTVLWERCDGAVVTSATLAALGRFDRFFEQAGLGPSYGTQALRLDSPFDYANRAELVIPTMRANAKHHDAHTAEIVERIEAGLIDPASGTLVLFSSYRQMHAVAEMLRAPIAKRILMQGTAPRHELLARHRKRIAAGKGSVLFGVASFSEGVDLPGAQCTHVIVAKLPFSVPDSPVEATRAEWLEARGRNPFMEMSVPDASFRLVQAAGRLLRTESDSGRVTVLDRRLVDKPYGRAILNALPPFRRAIESGSRKSQ